MDTLGYVPDSWIQGVSDLINNSGGSYTTEGGSVITTETPDDDEEDDDDDFDCSTVSRVQVKGAKTAADCGPCLEGFQPNDFGDCIDDVDGVCPEGQVYNEAAGMCVDEIFYEQGQPCNTADGEQGLFNEDGECVVGSGVGDGGGDGDGDGKATVVTKELTKAMLVS